MILVDANQESRIKNQEWRASPVRVGVPLTLATLLIGSMWLWVGG